MNEEKKVKNNNNTVIAIVIIVIVMALVGLGIGAYYLYVYSLEYEEQGMIATEDVGGCSACQSNNQDYDEEYYDNTASSEYVNTRYGYSVESPEGFTSFEADNGDGITYTDVSGNIIRVYGTNNYEGVTLDQYLEQETNRLEYEAVNSQVAGTSELDLDGCDGKIETWEYISPVDSVDTMLERAICLKDNVFYVIDLETMNENYYDGSVIFDEVVSSFRFR